MRNWNEEGYEGLNESETQVADLSKLDEENLEERRAELKRRIIGRLKKLR